MTRMLHRKLVHTLHRTCNGSSVTRRGPCVRAGAVTFDSVVGWEPQGRCRRACRARQEQQLISLFKAAVDKVSRMRSALRDKLPNHDPGNPPTPQTHALPWVRMAAPPIWQVSTAAFTNSSLWHRAATGDARPRESSFSAACARFSIVRGFRDAFAAPCARLCA